MRLAFCDDSREVLSELESYVLDGTVPGEEIPDGSSILFDSFSSGEELLSYMEKTGETWQVYILDISMPGMSGIETAEQIRKNDRNCLIIFLTDYSEYVYQVFEVLPFRFLRKPLTREAFAHVIRQAEEHLRRFGSLFFLRIGREEYQVPCTDIFYFEARGRKVRLKTAEEEYLFYGQIKKTGEVLDGALFVQCHASYIVNMEKIFSVGEKSLLLRNQEEIPVSRKYKPHVREYYLRFVKWRCGK